MSESDREVLAFLEEEGLAACSRGWLRAFVEQNKMAAEKWQAMDHAVRELARKLRDSLEGA